MNIFVDFASGPTCVNMEFFGEICVNCNACGKIEKGLPMWQARYDMVQRQLDHDKNFTGWIKGWEHIQRDNIKINLEHFSKQLEIIQAWINYYNNKP